MIQNGLIPDGAIGDVKVIIDLIPFSNKSSRPTNKMIGSSITVHETANTRKGADAKSHTEYVDNTERYASWHFTVDDKVIYQELPINENAWHAGDGGNGKGNRTSIAIEICVNEDCDFQEAKENTRLLIQYLKNETGIEDIYSHKHWTGKECPKNILADGWDKFLEFLNEDVEPVDYWKDKFYELKRFVDEVIEGGK